MSHQFSFLCICKVEKNSGFHLNDITKLLELKIHLGINLLKNIYSLQKHMELLKFRNRKSCHIFIKDVGKITEQVIQFEA